MSICIVITTINQPGPVLDAWIAQGHSLVIVGDRKTPDTHAKLPLEYIDFSEQFKRYPEFAGALPVDHYARKNIGYLHAIENGCTIIGETDDDNYPLANWPNLPSSNGYDTVTAPRFPNVYKLFSEEHIWPRGFPLDRINADEEIGMKPGEAAKVFVWQGLVNGDPDIDAICRLSSRKNTWDGFAFKERQPVVLGKNVLCAFNTQNTIWSDARAFPFLYLPSTVSFRATDIVRSYVAQYCIWAMGGRLGFTRPTVVQERNEHNLIEDLESEWVLYTRFHSFVDALESVSYTGTPHDLYLAYDALTKAGLVEERELDIVEKWLKIAGKTPTSPGSS